MGRLVIVPGYHDGAELYFVTQRQIDGFSYTLLYDTCLAIYSKGANGLETALLRLKLLSNPPLWRQNHVFQVLASNLVFRFLSQT